MKENSLIMPSSYNHLKILTDCLLRSGSLKTHHNSTNLKCYSHHNREAAA